MPLAVLGGVLDPPCTPDGTEDGDGGEGGGQVVFLAGPAAVTAAVGARLGVRLARSGPAPPAPAAAGAGVVASAAAAPGAVLVAKVELTGGDDDDDGGNGDGWSSIAAPLVALVHTVEWAVAMLAAAPSGACMRGAGSGTGGADGVDGGRVAAAGVIPTVAPALAGSAPVEVVGVVDVTPPPTAIVGADEAAVGEGVGGGRETPHPTWPTRRPTQRRGGSGPSGVCALAASGGRGWCLCPAWGGGWRDEDIGGGSRVGGKGNTPCIPDSDRRRGGWLPAGGIDARLGAQSEYGEIYYFAHVYARAAMGAAPTRTRWPASRSVPAAAAAPRQRRR